MDLMPSTPEKQVDFQKFWGKHFRSEQYLATASGNSVFGNNIIERINEQSDKSVDKIISAQNTT